MSEPSADHVIDIDKTFPVVKRLAALPPIASECCIFKVRDPLRNQSKEAYEPEVVSIGPYHQGKVKLKPMEDHKLRYLQQFLERNETSVEKYIVAMQKSEQKARKFYADPIHLNSIEFVEMMLLDSCFIIQLFHKFVNEELRKDDPIFQLEHILSSIMRDLMLFENQLPFFVLMKLFNMPQNPAASLNNFVYMSCEFFEQATPCELSVPPFRDLEKLDIKHLLGLLHYCCCYQFHSIVSQSNVPIEKEFLKSATELREAGIKFKKVEDGSLFNITFVNGTIGIPILEVDDDTESFLRNLIAYENYLPVHDPSRDYFTHPDNSRNYFTAYMNFMDFLVNSSEDVEILSHHEIIHNLLGDNAVVSTMLSKLGNNVVIPFFGYHEVYNNVNKHCEERWYRWLAILRRDYFNTPWALISFLVALLLLVLTLIQTIFSILSFV